MKRKREEKEDNTQDKNEDEHSDEDEKSSKKVKYTIEPIPTSKDNIKQPKAAEKEVIPRITSSVILNGSSGSGKTTLLANLLTKKEFYKGFFDRIFLISPTGKSDDIQKYLKLSDDDIIDDLGQAAGFIQELMDSQRQIIETEGADKAPQYAIVYDDVIADTDFTNSTQFVKSFIASRHYNFTTFLCSQSWTACPRRCRLQAMNICFFKGSNSENELIAEEYTPPDYTKKQFLAVVEFATREDYSFLHINKRVDFKIRYRRNLDQVIKLDLYNYDLPQPEGTTDVNISDKKVENYKEEIKNVKFGH